MKRLSIIITMFVVGLSLTGCLESRPISEGGSLAPSDVQQIRALSQNWIDAWMADDADRVMSYLTSDVVLIPGGRVPMTGHDVIRNYWWPNDGSITTITRFEVEILEIQGEGDIAFTREHGMIEFTYEIDGSVSELSSESYSLSTLKRQADGSWKYDRRMWASVNN